MTSVCAFQSDGFDMYFTTEHVKSTYFDADNISQEDGVCDSDQWIFRGGVSLKIYFSSSSTIKVHQDVFLS